MGGDLTMGDAFWEHDAKAAAAEAELRPTRRNVHFLLLRHAESEANLRKGEIGGRQNSVGLSEGGVEQAKRLGRRLKGKRLDAVFASVASRATDTAQIACAEAGFPVERIVYDETVVEQSQGSWERRSRQEVYTEEVMARMNSENWEWAAPGASPIDGAQGESQRDVEARMVAFVEGCLSAPDDPALCAAPPEANAPINTVIEKADFHTVAIFTHGMAIKCLLRALEQSSPSVTHKRIITNTSITEVKYSIANGGAGGWFVECVNDASHLQHDS